MSNSLWPPGTVAHQAPLPMEFSRQESWRGLPFPSSGDLPHPGIEARSPALQADSLPAEPQYVKTCKQTNKKDLDVNLRSVPYSFALYYFVSQTGCGSQWWYLELSRWLGSKTGWGSRLEEPPFSQGGSRSCVSARTVSSGLLFLRQCFSLTCLWTYPL